MNNPLSLSNYYAFNFLESPILNSFYNLRECYYYYLSLKLVNTRREFYDKIKNNAIEFIGLVNSKEIEELLNNIAFSEKTKISINEAQTENLIDIMKREDFAGFKLLELTDPISIEILKSCYRVAAIKHHPDKGGLTENMQIINNAYDKFHKILCFANISEVDSNSIDTTEISNISDFITVIYEIIINITLDNWEIEECYKWVCKYFRLNTAFSMSNMNWIDLIPTLTSLAKKLFIANYKTDADYCLAKAQECLLIAKSEGLFYDSFVSEAEDVIIESGKYRVVVTHSKQASNLLKYNVITEKRYNDSLIKFKAKSDDEINKEEVLKEYLNNTGFLIDLPLDKFSDYVSIENKLIEEPGYFNYNFTELNNEQKTEYQKAFGDKSNIELVRKYIYVRLHSLIKSIISFKYISNLDNVLNELKFLKFIKAQRSSVDVECDNISELIRYYISLSKEELIERLNLLTELDIHAEELAVTKYEYLTFINPSDIIFRISLNKRYYDIAKLSLDDLKYGLKTGKVKESKDVKKKNKYLERDLNLINEVDEKYGKMDLFKILDESKNNPEKVVISIRPYVNDLLDLGKRIYNVDELHVMYWIDKLTIAYVRNKDYKSTIELLDIVYKLPEEYWGRSNNSEREGIRKRYYKCLKEISKTNIL